MPFIALSAFALARWRNSFARVQLTCTHTHTHTHTQLHTHKYARADAHAICHRTGCVRACGEQIHHLAGASNLYSMFILRTHYAQTHMGEMIA